MGFQQLVEPGWLEKEPIVAALGRGKQASARHTTPIGNALLEKPTNLICHERRTH